MRAKKTFSRRGFLRALLVMMEIVFENTRAIVFHEEGR